MRHFNFRYSFVNEHHYTDKQHRRLKIDERETPEEQMHDRRKKKNYRFRTSNTLGIDRNLENE